MEFPIPQNVSASKTTIVDEALTAESIGSGSVDVLATPMMIALMEAAAWEAVQSFLPEGWTSVGTWVDIEHLRATAKGKEIRATATLMKQTERRLEFSVEAVDDGGFIGQGSHRRHIINKEDFMAKL